MATATKDKTKPGKIIQIVGVVVDIEFTTDNLPGIYNALKIKLDDREVTLEVAQHLSESSVRAISLSSTDGLERGAGRNIDQARLHQRGARLMHATLGRMFNVTGEPI